MSDAENINSGGLREYALVLWHRKVTIAAALIVTVLVTLAFSLHQSRIYQASVQVFLNSSNNALVAVGASPDAEAQYDPSRVVANETSIATSPPVINATVRSLGLSGAAADDFKGGATVTGDPDRDILVFATEAGTQSTAIRYANAYARTYTAYQGNLQTASLGQALAGISAQLQKLRGSGNRALYDQLVTKQEQLKVAQTLQTGTTVVLGPADSASLIQPQTKRNVGLGVILGLLLGVALALARNAFDNRIRSGEQVEAVLAMPLLGRLAPPPRRAQGRSYVVMQEDPFGLHAEAFRMLRTSLDFAMASDDRASRTQRSLAVVSALPGEGKTTTAANLAATYARAGLRVGLVDLDLRRPSLSSFFGSDRRSNLGLTDVAVGRASLDEVICNIPLSDPAADAIHGDGSELHEGNGSVNGAAVSTRLLSNGFGELALVPAGTIPPNTGEFVSTRAVEEVLDELRSTFELLIIDTPPLLTFADALAISSRCDGILIVARLNVVSRTTLREVKRAIAGSGELRCYGFVLTGVDDDADYQHYGNYGAYRRYAQPPAGVHVD